MKGPFRRNREGRASDPDPAPTDAPVTVVEAPVQFGPLEPADGAEVVAPPEPPGFLDRSRLRRRLRYLRRVRELGFRDLGGLVFDLHRFARRNDDVVLAKLQALEAVDRELRAIERVLDERRDVIELREPGVAACPRCGALHGSDARFCPQCGMQLDGALELAPIGAPSVHPAPARPVTAPAGTAPPVPPAGTDQPTAAFPAPSTEHPSP